MSKKNIIYRIRRVGQRVAYHLLSHEMLSGIYFRHVLGYKLDLNNPKTFNEKLQWLKLYYWPINDKAIICADKYKVRDYIRDVGKGELLNDIIGCWASASDIPWSSLPEQFALKCNHGCGYNLICEDKSKLSEAAVRRKFSKWMSQDYGHYDVEPHYDRIPKRIICEKFLGGNVVNYNIYVFNGKATFLSVAGGLGNGIDEYLTYYYPDGNVANFKNRHYPNKEDTLSPLLPQMIETAEFLGKEFPMVRVDLFDVDGRIILSEMTFTPGGALIPFDSYESDLELGKKLDISGLRITP